MAMTLEQAIRERRSVRAFAPTPVPREAIERCLEAARLAPSACNSQPWTFIVVDEPRLKDELARRAFSGPYAMNAFARGAPVLIVVVTERSRPAAWLGGLLRRMQYPLIDIGIAGEHLALQAAAEGLGTCWLGWFNERAVRRTLGLPWGARLDVVFCLGYPAEPPDRPASRKSLDDIRRYNR
jgi:nitroreductase